MKVENERGIMPKDVSKMQCWKHFQAHIRLFRLFGGRLSSHFTIIVHHLDQFTHHVDPFTLSIINTLLSIDSNDFKVDISSLLNYSSISLERMSSDIRLLELFLLNHFAGELIFIFFCLRILINGTGISIKGIAIAEMIIRKD